MRVRLNAQGFLIGSRQFGIRQSLVPQRDHGIDAGRAPSWNVAGDQRHRQHQGRDGHEGERVIEPDTDQQARQNPADRKCSQHTHNHSGADRRHRLPDDQPQYAVALGTYFST